MATHKRAFIVRPFGTKDGINFDDVQEQLITPALSDAKVQGSTTEVIARAGNIRTDMFEQLLLADVVIADISIHNANVFYELGIRHSLRPRTTIIIRADKDAVPFDLATDRYLKYDAAAPGNARQALAKAVQQSLDADNPDSPVFLLLPALKAADLETFRPVPAGFTQEVMAARRGEDLPMLAVLADEAADFEWGPVGLRMIAEAQVMLRAWWDARATCEEIRKRRPTDAKANLLLATIEDRLGDPVASMAALERISRAADLAADDLAEARALKGRNIKNLWIAAWKEPPEKDRAAAALRSAHLDSAREAYDQAFLTDQNHWYSGINSLALIVATVTLAEQAPGVWSERFEEEGQATSELQGLERERDELVAALRRSLAAKAFRTRGGVYNVWADLTRADLRFLTSEDPAYVAGAYQQARARSEAEKVGSFQGESAAQQIRLFLELGLFTDRATAALAALGVPPKPPASAPRNRVIVFSGHRLDAPARTRPRFPNRRESIDAAAAMIRAAISAEKELAGPAPVEGVAGGASGGDILFHELCRDLEIATTLLLAMPRDDYVVASVADAGPEWVERFRNLVESLLNVKIMPPASKELPDWLARRQDYSIWQRNNRWTLHTALSRSNIDISLIVLWDGEGGDGPGGTGDMVKLAESRGVKVVRLDAAALAEAG